MIIHLSYVEKNQIVETKYESLIECKFSKETLDTLKFDAERTDWNKILLETCSSDDGENITMLLSKLNQGIKNYSEKIVQQKYANFLTTILEKYNQYVLESEENKYNQFHQLSYQSLLQLIRFFPELPEKKSEIYLDEMSGCFGIIIQSAEKGKPILNLLMRENKEVVFSFIKRKNKIIKISGRAYFNDCLEDSDEIKNILQMINLC